MCSDTHSLVNFAHLDHLGEDVTRGDVRCRIIHIYAAAPDYNHSGDPEEGTSCVDDVARAAVIYLQHYELTRDERSRNKAESLLRFILYMQAANGLFYNFVHNNRLDINRDHFRSWSNEFNWWTARAVWALAVGARVLHATDAAFAHQCVAAARRALPHVQATLANYPTTEKYNGRTVPTWLIGQSAADATGDLLMGLVALNKVEPDTDLRRMIEQYAEGIALMRYGSMTRFPFGCHASNKYGWHGWGNAQTQALAEANILTSAMLEAGHFYPRLLIEGHLHSITFDDLHAIQYFQRIAYGVRGVVVGLVRLFQATQDRRYAIMAGLAASWFTGNNEPGEAMYNSETGRGYDGLDSNDRVNYNAGAESTIETLYSILEVEQVPLARSWMYVTGDEPKRCHIDAVDYLYRVFARTNATPADRAALVMNLTQESLDVLEGKPLEEFLARR